MVLVTVLMLFLWVMLISWILMSPVGIAVTLGYGIQKGQLTTLHSRMKREIQATTKMTLQNRLALDMLLLKEHGVCGYLKGQIDHCCIHIPNVTADVEHDISQLKQIEHEAQKEQKDLATSWLGNITVEAQPGTQTGDTDLGATRAAGQKTLPLVYFSIIYLWQGDHGLEKGIATSPVTLVQEAVIQPPLVLEKVFITLPIFTKHGPVFTIHQREKLHVSPLI
ncbi:uncharacterized protein LOC134552888 [Prinia subflava]|uniref:uncharacterized protein LOC134552888 n=1 Tax=Prinia subflava TaxID=208062 RepID=UPI002FDFF75C